MSYAIWIGFLGLVTIDTAAQICIKLAVNRIQAFELDPAWLLRAVNEPLLYLVVMLFPLAFLIYMNLLRHVSVGPVYAAAHAHIVTVLAISVVFFGERLGTAQVLGALLILCGVSILAATEKGEQAHAA